MSIIIYRGLIFLLCALLSMQIVACTAESAEIGKISPTELMTEIQSAQPPLILDVRSEEEYREGHVPGAINIHFKELENRLEEIEEFKDSTVVVYCERGFRANIAKETLQEADFQAILHLEGDMSAWRDKSLPIEGNSE